MVLDHTQVKENQVIAKDIRAPLIEFTFDMQNDASKQDQIEESVKMTFNKVQLQMFFEELEKI